MTGTSVTGKFGNIDWDTNFDVGGYTFQIHNSGSGPGIYLEVIPEPATTALLGLAGLALLVRRRRR